MPLSSIKVYVNRARTLPMRAALRGASPDPAPPWPRPTLPLHAPPDREQAPIDGADPLKGELELALTLTLTLTPQSLTCSEVTMPLITRSRIMKVPGFFFARCSMPGQG